MRLIMNSKVENIFVIDLETSIKNRGDDAVGNIKASPHAPKNKIVYAGWIRINNKDPDEVTTARIPDHFNGSINLGEEVSVIVGQNIKFDLLYLMRTKQMREDELPKLRIWDTMVVEYLLTGQESRLVSLDKLVTKYGGTLKDDKVKALWDADIDTEDIDESIIRPYLKEDVKNTAIVFKGQLAEANRLGMLPLIKAQMDALLATTEMEYNGMHFDKVSAVVDKRKIEARIHLLEMFLADRMNEVLKIDISDVNPASTTQVSKYLFGGEIKYKVPVKVLDEHGNPVFYKSGPNKGAHKMKSEVATRAVAGVVKNRTFIKETKKAGIYETNDEVLKNISTAMCSPHLATFCRALLDYRTLKKDVSTYYDGYSDLVWPHDNCIHPQFNHCITATGRLSHSAPNLGNVSHKKE